MTGPPDEVLPPGGYRGIHRPPDFVLPYPAVADGDREAQLLQLQARRRELARVEVSPQRGHISEPRNQSPTRHPCSTAGRTSTDPPSPRPLPSPTKGSSASEWMAWAIYNATAPQTDSPRRRHAAATAAKAAQTKASLRHETLPTDSDSNRMATMNWPAATSTASSPSGSPSKLKGGKGLQIQLPRAASSPSVAARITSSPQTGFHARRVAQPTWLLGRM